MSLSPMVDERQVADQDAATDGPDAGRWSSEDRRMGAIATVTVAVVLVVGMANLLRLDRPTFCDGIAELPSITEAADVPAGLHAHADALDSLVGVAPDETTADALATLAADYDAIADAMTADAASGVDDTLSQVDVAEADADAATDASATVDAAIADHCTGA